MVDALVIALVSGGVVAAISLLFGFTHARRARREALARTPAVSLHDAATMNDLESLRAWLQRPDVDPDLPHLAGETALHRVAAKGHVEAARLLLAKGANPNARAKDGETPLHVAALDAPVELVRMLLEAGADPSAKATADLTPLHVAATRGDLEVVRALLDAGASVSAVDAGQNTALHRAAIEGHLGVLSLLLERGADPTARGYNGMTPLSLAVFHRREAATALLRQSSVTARSP